MLNSLLICFSGRVRAHNSWHRNIRNFITTLWWLCRVLTGDRDWILPWFLAAELSHAAGIAKTNTQTHTHTHTLSKSTTAELPKKSLEPSVLKPSSFCRESQYQSYGGQLRQSKNFLLCFGFGWLMQFCAHAQEYVDLPKDRKSPEMNLKWNLNVKLNKYEYIQRSMGHTESYRIWLFMWTSESMENSPKWFLEHTTFGHTRPPEVRLPLACSRTVCLALETWQESTTGFQFEFVCDINTARPRWAKVGSAWRMQVPSEFRLRSSPSDRLLHEYGGNSNEQAQFSAMVCCHWLHFGIGNFLESAGVPCMSLQAGQWEKGTKSNNFKSHSNIQGNKLLHLVLPWVDTSKQDKQVLCRNTDFQDWEQWRRWKNCQQKALLLGILPRWERNLGVVCPIRFLSCINGNYKGRLLIFIFVLLQWLVLNRHYDKMIR